MTNVWRKCSSCKKDLFFNQPYWACNVSTCNRSRTFLSFCSVSCWDAHLGMARHRESWAEERKAPTEELWNRVLAGEEVFPPRVEKAKPKEQEKPKEASGVKTVIRRKPT